jgi:hypothetical protein
MRFDYVVILKKENEQRANLVSLLLCLMSVTIFLYSDFKDFFVRKIHDDRIYISLVAAAILFIGLVINLILWRRSVSRVRFRFLLLAAAVGWAFSKQPWMAGLFMVLILLEWFSKRPSEIGFHHDKVVLNMTLKEQFTWKAFNNVILKDGLLTLDFANNRLLQKEVLEDDDEDNADEEEFNAYCRRQLAAARPPQNS